MTREIDGHLRCAAMISAADRLMSNGTVPADALVVERGLVAAMTHLNAYAIPQGIGEPEAFAAVKAERDRILASLLPAMIAEQARKCIEQI